MKSVRLDAALEDKLRRAAALAGVSESAIIRDAVAAETDRILGTSLYEKIKPFIGIVHGNNNVDASRSSEAFEEALVEEFARQQEEFAQRQEDARLRRSS